MAFKTGTTVADCNTQSSAWSMRLRDRAIESRPSSRDTLESGESARYLQTFERMCQHSSEAKLENYTHTHTLGEPQREWLKVTVAADDSPLSTQHVHREFCAAFNRLKMVRHAWQAIIVRRTSSAKGDHHLAIIRRFLFKNFIKTVLICSV